MKTMILALVLAVSTNSFANDFTMENKVAKLVLFSAISSSMIVLLKEAQAVVDDSQGYIQTGKLSAFLSQKIKDVKELNSELSDEEAIDLLLEVSEAKLQ
jgi:hypothetical protein